MLKERFITQSAPNIGKKLQKLALGPSTQLGELLKMASLVFYSRDQEEKEKVREREQEKETQRNTKRWTQLLADFQV